MAETVGCKPTRRAARVVGIDVLDSQDRQQYVQFEEQLVAREQHAFGPSGERRNVEHLVMLPETKLDQVEEIAAEQVPMDTDRAERGIEIKRAEIGVAENDGVNARFDGHAGYRLIAAAQPAEQIDAQRLRHLSIDQRLLRPRVEIAVDVQRVSGPVRAANPQR